MTDITLVLVGIIALLCGVVTIVIVPWFRENRAKIKDERIAWIVDSACRWAEQTLKDATGPEKRRRVLEYVQAWLNERGYTYDPDQLEIYLEASVFDIDGGIDIPIPVAVTASEDDGK